MATATPEARRDSDHLPLCATHGNLHCTDCQAGETAAKPARSAGLYAKLFAVMQECAYIQRDKRNDFHHYTYASEAAIKDTLHAACVKNRLLFLPVSVEVASENERTTGKGNKEIVTTVKLRYRFQDVDTGESCDAVMLGSGSDSLDKGVYKAITGAIKYALTGTFLIATGDDPEKESGGMKSRKEKKGDAEAVAAEKIATLKSQSEHKPGCITQGQQKRFFAICNEAGKDRVAVKAWLLASYGIEHTAEIPAEKYDEICALVREL